MLKTDRVGLLKWRANGATISSIIIPCESQLRKMPRCRLTTEISDNLMVYKRTVTVRKGK